MLNKRNVSRQFNWRSFVLIAGIFIIIGPVLSTVPAVQAENTRTIQSGTKTVTVNITDTSGVGHPQVSVYLAPLFTYPTPLGGGQDCTISCNFETSVSGRYLVKADCNLGSSNPTGCPFIGTENGQIVDFTLADDVVENKTVNIVMAPATNFVSLAILDANGDSIYTGGFQADITFTGHNDLYGVVSTRRKVDTSGVVTVGLIPGVWTVSVSLTELGSEYEHQSFNPDDMTFVLPQPAVGESDIYIDWGSVQANVNQGAISGTVTAGGTAVEQGTQLVATNLDTKARFQSNTVQNGEYAFELLPYGNYMVTVSDPDYLPGQNELTNLTVAFPSASGVNLEVNSADMTIYGIVWDDGVTVTDLPAAVVAEAANGAVFTAPVNANGSYTLYASSDLTDDATELTVHLLTQPGATEFLSSPATIDVFPNVDTSQSLQLSNNEATITGQIVKPSGSEVTSADFGSNALVKAINVDNGSTEQAVVQDDGSFSLSVGKGDWKIVPDITDISSTVVSSTTGSEEVTVTAGQEKTVEIEVQKVVGTVAGTVTDPDGAVLQETPIVFTNLPALQNEALATGTPIDQAKIIEVTTSTDNTGQYSFGLPKGDFTAYFMSNPDIDNLIEAPSQDFSITKDETTTVDAEYREASASVSGTIQVPGDNTLVSPSVIAYSPDGGTQELTVDADAGTFSGTLSPGDWQIVVSGVTNDKLMLGQDLVTVSAEGETFNPSVSNTGIDFPAAVSTSGSVSDQIVLGNTAGAQVTIPAYAAGFNGSVTAELVPDPQIVFSNGVAQVGLAYDVNVTDSTTGALVSQLNQEATITLPISTELMPTGGTDSNAWVPGYYNASTESNFSDGMVADTDGSNLVIQTDHFTRFSATTTVMSTPNHPRALDVKKIRSSSAIVDWKTPRSSTVATYTVQVRKSGATKRKNWVKLEGITLTQKKVSDLLSQQKYQFRVKACNATSCSTYTSWKKFTTKP